MIEQETPQPTTTLEIPSEPPTEPVMPSASSATPPQAPTPPVIPPSSGRGKVWAAIMAAFLLVVASSGITYFLVTDEPEADQAATATNPVGEDEQTASPYPVVPGEEPVADAAAVILPSVVQIQAGGGVGSGVIYDSNGLILTAAHVVAGSDTVTVRFEDGEQVPGQVLGGTSGADVAVVKVDRTGLPAAELALDEQARVGQLAIAVGSPWGLQGTVTSGIISAIDQPVDGNALLQTDAAINPGNSGGALVDREGRVLGINVSIFTLSGANDGVGFAVPIDVAADIASRVVNGESIGFAMLGVTGSDVESGRAGAMITEVTPGSAAAKGGVQVGDLVVSLDGVEVQGIADLAAQVRSHRPGTTVDVVVVRNGQEQTLTVTLDERPADLG